MREELWKPVVGWEKHYMVSNNGRVRSAHTIGRPAVNGIIAIQKNKKGYCRVRLQNNGAGITVVVHRLVAEAFIGGSPSRIHEINHKNGIKDDNRVENIEWVTPVENNAHSVANGFWHPHVGSNHGRAKICEADAIRIKGLAWNASAAALGKEYGISGTAVRLIWRGINWKHV